MNMKITRKELKEHFYCARCGYCDVQHLMRGVERSFYNKGIYGWNYDVYTMGNTALSTGYRGMPGVEVYDIARKYDDRAEECLVKKSGIERDEIMNRLRNDFWKEVRQYVKEQALTA